MELRSSSDDASNLGMGRALGAAEPSGIPGTYAKDWAKAWEVLWEAFNAHDTPHVKKAKACYGSYRWCESVQIGFPEELAAFAALADEELDASLAMMRDVKPWAFWIAACECMLREHEVGKGMRDKRVTDREEQAS